MPVLLRFYWNQRFVTDEVMMIKIIDWYHHRQIFMLKFILFFQNSWSDQKIPSSLDPCFINFNLWDNRSTIFIGILYCTHMPFLDCVYYDLLEFNWSKKDCWSADPCFVCFRLRFNVAHVRRQYIFPIVMIVDWTPRDLLYHIGANSPSKNFWNIICFVIRMQWHTYSGGVSAALASGPTSCGVQKWPSDQIMV